MIGYICLYWIGMVLDAPFWYFGLLLFGLFCKVLAFVMDISKQNN